MLRRFLAGLALAGALLLGAFGPIGSAGARSAGFCSKFDGGAQDNWIACPSQPNIGVTTLPTGGVPASGGYLQLTDQSGASLACSSNKQYQGNWIEKVDGCGELCFDFQVYDEGSPPLPVRPYIGIIDGGGNIAAFVANFTVGPSTPPGTNWVHICAPVKEILPGQNLPSNAQGQWMIGGSPAYTAQWHSIITNVASVYLPVDFTSQPSEIVGYDNLCTFPGGNCHHDPVVTGCLKDTNVTVACNADGTYTVTLSGSSFTGTDITLTSETPGVTVTPPQQPWAATTAWTISGATPGQTIVLAANATKAGAGSVPGTDQCCSGEITIVMPDCPVDLTIAKENTPEGHFGNTFTLTVTNNGGSTVVFPPNGITVTETVPNAMTVTGIGPPPWVCMPLTATGPASILCTYSAAVTLTAGQQLAPPISVSATRTGPGPWVNCATVGVSATSGHYDSDLGNNKDCITIPGPPIDLSITKTGSTSPAPQVPNYSFQLTVRNVGAPFNGNNLVTVRDVVPAGMSFASAVGAPDWSCNAPPAIAAGGTLTCTYVGTGPTTTGQIFSPINIAALATGSAPFPPFTNCATVGLTAASGLVDVNPPDNTACVTVKKPILACPPPMVPGAAPGQCLCPPGTSQVGDSCVRLPPPACRPPLVPGPVAGQCICPFGTVPSGKDCVRPPPACRPPLVPGPVAGQCICPFGTVPSGKDCVRPPPACRPPFVPGPVAGQCICPAGWLQRGRSCVQPTLCNPPAKLNRRGACECPTNMVASGNTCVERQPRPPAMPPDRSDPSRPRPRP